MPPDQGWKYEGAKGHIETGNWVLSYFCSGKVVEKQPSSFK